MKLFGLTKGSNNNRIKENPSLSERAMQVLKPMTNSEKIKRESNIAMKGAQRETYRFDIPEQEMGVSSLIKNHVDGERFIHAAVFRNNSEDIAGKTRKLIQWTPKNTTKNLPINELPILRLYNETETYNLSSVIGLPKKGDPPTYIRIDEILIMYGALISHDSDFSKVRVAIVDDRMRREKITKAYIANTNISSKASISLAYPVPRDEISKLSLTISRESSFLEDDCQWGAAQVKISMTESTFPFPECNEPIVGINVLPQTALEERTTNPDKVDISIMNNDREGLRNLYMNGDLVDESAPITNKFENVKYAKSSLSGPKGKKLTSL